MRHAIFIPVLAALFTVAASLSNAQPLHGGNEFPVKPATKKPDGGAVSVNYTLMSPAKPAPKKPDAAMEKIRALVRTSAALDIALELFSGNQADLLSKNKTALLSGNSPKLLSGNSPNLLSGNAPKVLSENQTPIFSGNKISFFSNFRVEIHIENSGNGAGGMPGVRATAPAVVRPRASQMVEPESSEKYAPPGIPGQRVGPR